MNADLPAFIVPILEIVWINVILSGDNAIVIALACGSLPPEQRSRGMIVGAGAAIILRIIFTLIFVKMLALPFVKLVGGLLLLWIAVQLGRGARGEKQISTEPSFLAAIRAIVIADAIMSLDNVVAIAAAAKGSVLLVCFGLALSVPLIAFGSTLLTGLLTRFPALIWAGAAMLGFVGGQLIATDKLFAGLPLAHGPYFEIGCGLCGAALVLVLARFLPRGKKEGSR